MDKKTILIVNDDGIQSEGIEKLATVASKYGEVWVVAPDSQRSATSHKINYARAIEVWKYDDFVKNHVAESSVETSTEISTEASTEISNAIHAYACDGTPADCVRIGIKMIGRKPDYVFSGINTGYNIGADIQYSATVGAALEGAFWGIHSIAFSQADPSMSEVRNQYLEELMVEYMEKPLGKNQIWNINFPNCTLNECGGIMRDCVVSQDDFYEDDYEVTVIDENRAKYKVIAGRNWNPSEGTDLYAAMKLCVSVGIVNNLK